MRFGCTSKFAIDYVLNDDCGGAWLFGKFCFWIDGEMIGDFDLGTSMRDVLFSMTYIAHYAGRRDGESLCQLGTEDCFNLIDSEIYGDPTSEADREVEYLKFEIRPNVDVLDEWKIYLISCGKGDRVLYKLEERFPIREMSLPSGLVDDVIMEFYNKLDGDYDMYSEI